MTIERCEKEEVCELLKIYQEDYRKYKKENEKFRVYFAETTQDIQQKDIDLLQRSMAILFLRNSLGCSERKLAEYLVELGWEKDLNLNGNQILGHEELKDVTKCFIEHPLFQRYNTESHRFRLMEGGYQKGDLLEEIERLEKENEELSKANFEFKRVYEPKR